MSLENYSFGNIFLDHKYLNVFPWVKVSSTLLNVCYDYVLGYILFALKISVPKSIGLLNCNYT